MGKRRFLKWLVLSMFWVMKSLAFSGASSKTSLTKEVKILYKIVYWLDQRRWGEILSHWICDPGQEVLFASVHVHMRWMHHTRENRFFLKKIPSFCFLCQNNSFWLNVAQWTKLGKLTFSLSLEREAVCNPNRVVSSIIGNFRISLCFITNGFFLPLFYKDTSYVAVALGRCFGGRDFWFATLFLLMSVFTAA